MLFSGLNRSAASNTQRRKPARGRSESIIVRARRWMRRVFLFAFLSATIATGSFIYYRASDFLYRSSYFKIDQIRILDVPGEVARNLENTKQVRSFRGRNLLLLDPKKVEERIAELPSLANVRAIKKYPNTLVIRARERHAVAIVSGEDMAMIDSDGVLLEPVEVEGEVTRDLPFISGVNLTGLSVGERINDPQLHKAIDLLGKIKVMNPDLHARISEVTLDATDGMALILAGGIEVKLGKRDPVELMPFLEEFLRTHPDVAGPAVVDLCFKNQLLYRESGKPQEAQGS